MTRNIFACLGVAVALAWPAVARAALCEKCRDLMYIDSVGTCESCGGKTASGALKLCPKCSEKLHKCEHCMKPLDDAPAAEKGGDGSATPEKPPLRFLPPIIPSEKSPSDGHPVAGNPPANSPPANNPPINNSPPVAAARPAASVAPPPVQVKPIDPNKPGTYVIGKWQYTLQITGSGTRSEGRSGWLLYDGQKLPRGDVNDYVRTPWGPIYWVGVAQTQWGLHGWMLFPSRQTTRVGREMNSPAGAIAAVARAPGQQPPQQNPWQEIVRTDNGKRIRAPLGRYVLIRLPGNPTTGFRWQTATLNGQSVRLLGEPQYVAAPAKPGVVGTGGTFFFKFQAVQPGATTIKLVYVRPWDKDRGPADAFACTVEVMSPQPLPPARAIRPVTQN